KFEIYGNVTVEDLLIAGKSVWLGMSAVVDGGKKLAVKCKGSWNRLVVLGYMTADEVNIRANYMATLFSGCIWAKSKITINSVATLITMFGRVFARDIQLGGFYANVGGWA